MVRVKCPRCGYEWEYRGRMLYATCPRCCRKVRVEPIGPEESGVREQRYHYIVVVRESEYQKHRDVFIACAEEAGARWREGEGTFAILDHEEEWIECVKSRGIELRIEPL